MTFKVLGLDPGKSTGYFLVAVEEVPLSHCDCTLPMRKMGDHDTHCKIHRRIITPTTKFGVTKDMTLVDIKDIIAEATHICYEGWKTRPGDARRGAFDWNNHPAAQVIGSLKTIVKMLGTDPKVHENQAVSKPVGYGWAGMKYVKGKSGMHAEDALAHAVHYAVDKLKALPVRRQVS